MDIQHVTTLDEIKKFQQHAWCLKALFRIQPPWDEVGGVQDLGRNEPNGVEFTSPRADPHSANLLRT